MKKKLSILSLLLVFTMTAMAQIEFISNGNVIPDGSEFNVYAHTEDYGGGFKITEYSGNDPFIKNTGSEATTISVTIKKDNPEDVINWCGITGQCAFINAGVEKASRSTSVKAGESVGLGAHYTFDEGIYKTVSFEVTASGGGVTRTIHMNIIYAETVNQYPINFDKDANASRADRPLRSVSITAAGAEKQTLTVNPAKVYNDLTTGTKFTCAPGDSLKAEFDYGGGWMHGYVYLDADNNGEFSFDASQNDQTGKDLVSYSFYGASGDASGFNSANKYINGDARSTLDCPEFKAPEVAGEYRVRFKIDWNNVDAGGRVDANNHIINNGGYIVDAILVVGNAVEPEPIAFVDALPLSGSTLESINTLTLTFDKKLVGLDEEKIDLLYNGTDSIPCLVRISDDDTNTIVVTLDKEQFLAGEYTFSIATGALIALDGTTNEVEVRLSYTIVADPEPQPIEGKYYILKSRLDGQRVAYEKNDGTIGLQENWATPSPLQMADLSFIWKANVVGTDSVRLQNVASKKYLDATYTLYQAYTTTEEGTTFRLTATEGSYYNLSDAKDLGFPYMHADASRSYVVRWEGASNKANQWQFVDVDAELVAPLLAQQDLNVELKAKLALLNEKIYQPIVEDFSNHGLLKSASQLSTNKQETKEGHISNLLDGDGNTYFHSTWSSVNTDSAYHFIQADLKQTVDSITVKYVRRNHSYNDSPKSIRVFATNNPAGDWDEIAVLESPTLQSYFGIIFCGGTLNFNLGNKYRYVRFVVEETHSGSVTNDNLFFSWSEFGIWDNNGEEFLPEDKRTEINNVIATAKQELKDLAATQSTIDQLVEWAAYVDKYVFLTDGEDYTNTTEQETERITYTRNFNNTQWQAWYVPFDIDYDAISDDFTAASLNAVHQYDDDEDGVFERWTLEILKLKSGEVLRANMPYMIRAKETGEHNFVVENAILYPAEENSLDCSSVRVHYTFKGNYSLMDGQVLRDNGWFAPGGGSLVTPTAGSNLKAYRWLLMPEARSGYGTFYAPKRIDIVIGDEEGEVTGIEEVTQEEWPADVYDLNGRMVKAQAENLDELPKGVYIVNGKKFVK